MTTIVFGSDEAARQLDEDRTITYLESWSRSLIELEYWIGELYMSTPQWRMAQILVKRGEWKRKRGIDGHWAYRPKDVTKWKEEDAI